MDIGTIRSSLGLSGSSPAPNSNPKLPAKFFSISPGKKLSIMPISIIQQNQTLGVENDYRDSYAYIELLSQENDDSASVNVKVMNKGERELGLKVFLKESGSQERELSKEENNLRLIRGAEIFFKIPVDNEQYINYFKVKNLGVDSTNTNQQKFSVLGYTFS